MCCVALRCVAFRCVAAQCTTRSACIDADAGADAGLSLGDGPRPLLSNSLFLIRLRNATVLKGLHRYVKYDEYTYTTLVFVKTQLVVWSHGHVLIDVILSAS